MAAKRLNKFEEDFLQYEELFEEWRVKEENKLMELKRYLSEGDIAPEPEQAARLLETSNTIKEMTEKSIPKFINIVERLKELSNLFEKYSNDAPNRIADLAAKMERSFEGKSRSYLIYPIIIGVWLPHLTLTTKAVKYLTTLSLCFSL